MQLVGQGGQRVGHRWGFVVLSLLVLAWLMGGGAVRALAPHRQDDPAAQATATRAAELVEIADLKATVAALQTEVALAHATPTATVEPTQVPPLPAGQAVGYGATWTVVVVDAGTRPTVEELTATGIFVEVRLEVTNHAETALTFPFRDFQVRDAADRVYVVDQIATTRASPLVHISVDPSLPQELRLVFDVLPEAGEIFVLESTVDPTFRVEVALAQRG
jgi:hypothetical protein